MTLISFVVKSQISKEHSSNEMIFFAILFALFPLRYVYPVESKGYSTGALYAMRYALCAMRYALCAMRSALCALRLLLPLLHHRSAGSQQGIQSLA